MQPSAGQEPELPHVSSNMRSPITAGTSYTANPIANASHHTAFNSPSQWLYFEFQKGSIYETNGERWKADLMPLGVLRSTLIQTGIPIVACIGNMLRALAIFPPWQKHLEAATSVGDYCCQAPDLMSNIWWAGDTIAVTNAPLFSSCGLGDLGELATLFEQFMRNTPMFYRRVHLSTHPRRRRKRKNRTKRYIQKNCLSPLTLSIQHHTPSPPISPAACGQSGVLARPPLRRRTQ